ncbi:MAG: TIR domain-containing protein [Thermoplasmata archaeon]|nr:TIR domain-containing protein [Thermoplasmata archaeon]
MFISFHMDDQPQVNLLRAQAKDSDFGMAFRDYSVKEPFDEAWKSNCRQQIGLTSLTICMIGPETATREAVIWELEESYRQGHQVIGVRIFRDQSHPIPSPLIEHNAQIMNWNRDEIRDQLEKG